MGWTTAAKAAPAATPKPARSPAPRNSPAVLNTSLAKLHKPDWEHLVTLDFETFYDADYTLRKLSTSEYIRDERFHAQMVGLKIGKKAVKDIPANRVKEALHEINWDTHDLLAHHTNFDGFILSQQMGGIKPRFYYDTLSMARGLHSNDISAKLDDVAQYYGVGNKLAGVLDQAKGIRDLPPALYKQMAAYCKEDVRLTFEIFKLMLAQYPEDEIEHINLTCRLFCDPVLKVDLPLVEKELAREIAYKEALLLSSLGTEKQVEKMLKTGVQAEKEELKKLKDKGILEPTPRDILLTRAKIAISRDKVFADMLQAHGVEPPMKISPAYFKNRDPEKKWAYAFAKTDLAFTSLQEHPSQKVRDLVEMRLSVKSTTNETRAGRFLKAGAGGAALPVYLNYYGAHCVTGDVEVLTHHGWQRIDEWHGGEIAQVHPDQTIEFLPAEQFKGPVEQDWLHIDAPYLKGAFTLGHTMPYLKHGSMEWASIKAGNFIDASTRYVPLAGILVDSEGVITAAQMRVLAMVQADGSYETDTKVGRKLTIFVKKPRKILRARQLLAAAGVQFEEHTYESWPGYVRFIVRWADLPSWLQPERKMFGSWLLDSSPEAREALMDELQHWDGWVWGGQHCYSSSERANVDWVATLAHLTGRCASISVKPAKGNRRENYVVALRQRSHGMVRRAHMHLTQGGARTYCTITQTGFWLARSQGRIFVTGNTGRWSGGNKMNMQNLKREDPDDPENTGILRKSILAPKGHKVVVVDSGQIEARVNAWLAGQEDLLDAFRLADAGKDRDAYCKFADKIYGRRIEKKDKLERFVGKIAVLGLGYQMGANKFQNTLALGTMGPPVFFEEAMCKSIVNTYRRENYKIAQFWDFCSKTILPQMARGIEGEYKCLRWEKDRIWLPNGMALKYPNLRCERNEDTGWDEWSYDRKGERAKIYGGLLTENIVQALARIIVADQMLVIDKMGHRVVTTTHDEIVTVVKNARAEKCYKDMLRVMRTPPAWCSDIPLNCEGGFADNYSK